MEPRQPTLLTRQTASILMAAALVTMTVFASVRTVQLRSQLEQEGAEQSARQLATTLELWEGYVTDRVASWLVETAASEDLMRMESRGRAGSPWFEGIYIWERAEERIAFVYPPPLAVEEHDQLFRNPCLARAREISRVAPPQTAGAAFVRCRNQGAAVWLLASSLAAALLEATEDHALAYRVLTDHPPPVDVPLAGATARGLSLQRLVVRRTQAARLLRAQGRIAEAVELQVQTVGEITDLSGPALEATVTTAAQIVRDELPGAIDPTELAKLDRDVARAWRRVQGWREVRDRLTLRLGEVAPEGPLSAAQIGDRLSFASDIYGDSDMLLAYGPIGEGRYAAIHLRGDPLLKSLSNTTGKEGSRIAIVDSDGAGLFGTRTALAAGEMELSAQPFGRVFPQLRAVMLGPSPAQQTLGPTWLLGQLAPVLVALILGIVALMGRVAADRRQRDLLQRQQDFTARVTHELKTPIAGIRVMAETLEMGVISDEEKRMDFLRRIDQEAQRLEFRIDDILKVARARRPGPRTITDPMELAEEVVERWRGHFELAGVTLEADLHPCRELETDRGLLRDALSNLVDNALKYRREDRPGRCRVRCMEDGPWVVFEVTDDGIGIPPAHRRTIFERFARIEGPGRGKSGGHGLGLSFVAEAAAAHNGLIECREGFDGGARFILKLRSR